MNDDLDDLLKQPIALPDNGFSRNVMAGVGRLRKRDAALQALTELVLVAAVLVGASFTPWGTAMERFGDSLIASQPIIAGLSALALGWLVIQIFGQTDRAST
jgi:hypothetical protein